MKKAVFGTKIRIYTVPAVADRAAALAARAFGGYTLLDGIGGWIDEDEALEEEAVRVLEVIVETDGLSKLEDFLCHVDRIAYGLGEAAVLVTSEPVRTDMRWTS
jgi:hypothetical protein